MTDTKPIPSNALNPNDFVSIFTELRLATSKKDSSVAKLRAIRGRFEAMGCNMRALDLMLKLRGMEPEEAEMLLRDALRYSNWVQMKIGDQSDLFGSDDAPKPNDQARAGLAEAEAYNEGHAAGLAGRSSTSHRFQPGSPMAQKFMDGWSDAQDQVAEIWGIERPETGEAIKPPKKEKAPKIGKGEKAASPQRRGRRRAEGAAA
jgi:ribosome modulation factor